jgi:hypothetical protein
LCHKNRPVTHTLRALVPPVPKTAFITLDDTHASRAKNRCGASIYHASLLMRGGVILRKRSFKAFRLALLCSTPGGILSLSEFKESGDDGSQHIRLETGVALATSKNCSVLIFEEIRSSAQSVLTTSSESLPCRARSRAVRPCW